MYSHELTLIGYEQTKDNIGNVIKTPKRTNVLCKISSIGSSEFYDAQIAQLKPEIKFIMHIFEYAGQKEVEFNGVMYKVLRTYSGESVGRKQNTLGGEEIELTCERMIGSV